MSQVLFYKSMRSVYLFVFLEEYYHCEHYCFPNYPGFLAFSSSIVGGKKVNWLISNCSWWAFVFVQPHSEHHPEEPGGPVPLTGQARGCWDPGGVRCEVSQAGQLHFLNWRWPNFCMQITDQFLFFVKFTNMYPVLGQQISWYFFPSLYIAMDPEQHSKWFVSNW